MENAIVTKDQLVCIILNYLKENIQDGVTQYKRIPNLSDLDTVGRSFTAKDRKKTIYSITRKTEGNSIYFPLKGAEDFRINIYDFMCCVDAIMDADSERKYFSQKDARDSHKESFKYIHKACMKILEEAGLK